MTKTTKNNHLTSFENETGIAKQKHHLNILSTHN